VTVLSTLDVVIPVSTGELMDNWLWHTERIPPAVTAWSPTAREPLLVELVEILVASILAGFVSLAALAWSTSSARSPPTCSSASGRCASGRTACCRRSPTGSS
jgi:hypothetical protein